MRGWLSSLFKGRKNQAQLPDIDAPFQVMTVHGSKALSTVLALRAERMAEVPVAFGDRREFDDALETMQLNEGSYEEYLERGLELNVQEWVQQRFPEDPDYFTAEADDAASPKQVEPLSLAYESLTDRPKKEVIIGLIPVQHSWQVPAYLRTGNWNDCPEPEVHIAFFKHWFERYGAIVTGISFDTIEFSVDRPPSTMAQARQLAREQFAYCGDIVHQGVGTEANLAKVLLNGKNWYFWWD